MIVDDKIKPWGMSENTFCILMHLSQFTSTLVPGLGMILPVVMWLMNKDECPEVDRHGKVIVNWLLSFLIYSMLSMILCLVIVGLFAFLALLAINVIFIIIAAIKANNGEVWRYPFSIKFI